MKEVNDLPPHIALADELIAKNISSHEIEKHLSEAGYTTDDVAAALQHVGLSSKRGHSSIGALLICFGVMMCVVGFAILITSSHTGTAFDIALYGLTGTGGTSIVGGMALIFG